MSRLLFLLLAGAMAAATAPVAAAATLQARAKVTLVPWMEVRADPSPPREDDGLDPGTATRGFADLAPAPSAALLVTLSGPPHFCVNVGVQRAGEAAAAECCSLLMDVGGRIQLALDLSPGGMAEIPAAGDPLSGGCLHLQLLYE